MALATTAFQATRISTLDLGSTSGTGGLVELQNTGLVITDVADSTYVHWNTPAQGGGYVVDTGFSAIVSAVQDGLDFNGTGFDWKGQSGITGLNAQQSGVRPVYGIGFDTAGDIGVFAGGVTWGGVLLTASDAITIC